ncbi:homeobox protein 10-like [Teleopsis dalmanni]|uniref:homeobox protein 10-like n=1 Tax=Teleopsis dalmanni TaxID=139649 RepID=UPI0018CEA6CA|nr:homeobox protein 10-like [Teleopsis dalmanni]
MQQNNSDIVRRHQVSKSLHCNGQQEHFSCFCCAPDADLFKHKERRKSWYSDVIHMRKWLPQPLRKLSQSKVEKPSTEKSLIKKTSEKSLRLPQKHAEHEDETTSSGLHTTTTTYGVTSQHATSSSHHNTSQQDFEAEEEAGLELPPPMKPIQEPHLIANGPPAFAKDLKEIPASTGKMDGTPALDLNEIVQIVKETTEQHEENSKFLNPSYDMNNTSCSSEANGRGGELDLCYANNVNNVTDNNDENNTENNNTETALNKRRCALDELISTEELYIQDLSDIVNGYVVYKVNTFFLKLMNLSYF